MAQTVKSLPAIQETRVRSPGWDDPLEKEVDNPLQYSCLENPMDGGAWQGFKESEMTEQLHFFSLWKK